MRNNLDLVFGQNRNILINENLSKILLNRECANIMNYFNGIIFTKDSVLCKDFIKPEFRQYLENLLYKNEKFEINKDFESYAQRLLKFLERDKNINIINYFLNSGFYDPNNYSESLDEYLGKLLQVYIPQNIDPKVINKIINVRNYCLDEDELNNASIKNREDLNNNLALVSMFANGLKMFSYSSGYYLKSVVFIDKINDSVDYFSEKAQGTSFWFANIKNFEALAIYSIKLKNNNSPFFEEIFSKELLIKFIEEFGDFDDNIKIYSSFESEVSQYYNKSSANNEGMRLNPLVLFQIVDSMPIFSEDFSEMSDSKKEALASISISSSPIQNQIYNGLVSPKLTAIYLNELESNERLLIIQKDKGNIINGCIYSMDLGEDNFLDICIKNDKIFLLDDFDKIKKYFSNI